MNELKPCPFCGSPAHIVWNAQRKIFPPQKGIDAGECVGACAYCENCNAQIFTTATHLIAEMWNRREKPPRESRKKLPCPKCGTPRPETWFTCGMLEDKKVGIKCRECGFEVWDKTEIQAIREWNSEKRGTDG